MQYTKLIWRNGEPYSERFDDIYYSAQQGESIAGESEFNHVFLMNNGLPDRWQKGGDFVVAELGFGSGLNCLLTIREWLKHLEWLEQEDTTRGENHQEQTLHYIAIEKYPLSGESIKLLHSRHIGLKPFCDELTDNYPPAIEASHSRRLFAGRVVIHYKFMDAYAALADESLNVDAWYLDGFSPANNPCMWSEDLFEKLSQNSRLNATCSTYTSAGFVKRNLQNAGFKVNKVKGHGKKREMLVAKLMFKSREALKYSDKPWFAQDTEAGDGSTSDHSTSNRSKKATIIGAGIAGLSIAYSLIQRGFAITIIDTYGEEAKASSANLAAIVYPRLSLDNDVDTEFYMSAFCYATYLLKRLQMKHQEKFWSETGLLQSMGEGRIASILKKFDFNDDYISIVNDSLPKIIRHDKQVFVNYEMAGAVLPVKLCEAIKKECGQRLKIIQANVSRVKHSGKLWQCLDGSKIIDEAEILIIANGAETNKIEYSAMFPIESVRGQMIALNESAVSKKLSKVVNAGIYITPAMNQQHFVGGTYSRDSSCNDVIENDTDDLLKAVNNIFPGMFEKKDFSHAWVGFRAMSKDRVPIVGAVPDEYFFNEEYADICSGDIKKKYRPAGNLRGLYISAAHGSRGFTSSFICAEIISSLIAGEPSPVSKRVLDYLNPSRFLVNELKRR